MAEKIATRAAYGEALVALAEEYPELVVLDADLSGSTMTKGFAKAHPDRFYNMGIAEANMTGVAAGLAACGKKPFTNTFAMFAAGRAWEQVRNSIAYPRLNVKVVGSHGGLSVGEDGATHQCIEDYAIMRAIPNMMVVSPCDGPEMRQAVRALLDYDGPAYLRLGRLAVESVTDAIPGYTFHLGQGVTLRDGSDVTVIATGMMVQMALKAAESLAAEGLSVRVLDMQAPGRGAGAQGGAGDRGHRHHRGGQRGGRPGLGGGGVPGRAPPGAGGAPRRQRRVRPLRQGGGRPGGLRPHPGGHRGKGAPCGEAEEMTDIKLICLDMDGTLLGADHATVPARNIRALRAASERGAAVAVASGRPWGFLHEVAEQLGVLRYAVLSNGAAVLDVHTGEWLYRNCLPEETRQALTELLLEEGVPFEVYCEGESWIQRDRLEGVLAHTFSPEFRQVLREHARLPEELNAALRGRMAEKFHIFYVLPQRRKSLMERAAACGALEMVTSFAENLEFTAAGVNKGTAVQALSARLGLGPEQVMAFGDAGNDLELLAWAGWSFAMANASAEAKKAARYETGSNAEGGVGMAVERWLLAE